MKIKFYLLFFISWASLMVAQERKKLSLKESIQLVVSSNTRAQFATTQSTISKYELDVLKNNLYPSMKVSGQYLRLTNANVNSSLSSGNTSNSTPQVSQLLLGQASVSMPLYSGSRLKNSIKASENMYQSELAKAQFVQEELSIEVIELYAALYKSQEMAKLYEENKKTAHQRTTDFAAMVDNGLLAKNDLLKAQLQEANVELMHANTLKNISIFNYELTLLLGFSENTLIEFDIESMKKELALSQTMKLEANRFDLLAAQSQEKAAQTGIKIAKGNYYPTLTLMGGYIAFDLKDVITVNNAVNLGVGFSYDIASLFKNGKEVKLAKAKAALAQKATTLLEEHIKSEIHKATENYQYALKQSVVYQKSLEQSIENYRIVKDKYDNTLASTTELLEADDQQLQSKINFSLSQAEVALKYYQLQFAEGKLTQSFNINTSK
ncbi:MAG: TolC family protein [Flavobacterium sp.]|nr:TolC family protein [Flavobacterium sp.]